MAPTGAQADPRAATTAPRFERLLPPGPPLAAPELLAGAAPHARASDARPGVMVNAIATLDGRASVDGSTKALGGAADLELLLELRVIADAVLVGAGTLAAEGYKRLVKRPERRERRMRAGLAQDPLAVVASRRLELPWDAEIFAAPEQPVIVYAESSSRPPRTAAPVEIVRLERVTPEAMLGDLRGRGVRAVLCEGGPRLNRSLLAAGVVDDLYLTLAATITGDEDEPAIVAGPGLAVPARAELVWVLRHGSELFLRYRFGGDDIDPEGSDVRI